MPLSASPIPKHGHHLSQRTKNVLAKRALQTRFNFILKYLLFSLSQFGGRGDDHRNKLVDFLLQVLSQDIIMVLLSSYHFDTFRILQSLRVPTPPRPIICFTNSKLRKSFSMCGSVRFLVQIQQQARNDIEILVTPCGISKMAHSQGNITSTKTDIFLPLWRCCR